MPPPSGEDDATRQLRLVRKGILSGVTGCLEWENDRLQNRVRSIPEFEGLLPSEIKRLAVAYVRDGGHLAERSETDEAWIGRRNFDYCYGICFEIPGLELPVFLKVVLLDDDEELPEARIVGAHPSHS